MIIITIIIMIVIITIIIIIIIAIKFPVLRTETVDDEPGKILNLPFFQYFFRK